LSFYKTEKYFNAFKNLVLTLLTQLEMLAAMFKTSKCILYKVTIHTSSLVRTMPLAKILTVVHQHKSECSQEPR